MIYIYKCLRFSVWQESPRCTPLAVLKPTRKSAFLTSGNTLLATLLRSRDPMKHTLLACKISRGLFSCRRTSSSKKVSDKRGWCLSWCCALRSHFKRNLDFTSAKKIKGNRFAEAKKYLRQHSVLDWSPTSILSGPCDACLRGSDETRKVHRGMAADTN